MKELRTVLLPAYSDFCGVDTGRDGVRASRPVYKIIMVLDGFVFGVIVIDRL